MGIASVQIAIVVKLSSPCHACLENGVGCITFLECNLVELCYSAWLAACTIHHGQHRQAPVAADGLHAAQVLQCRVKMGARSIAIRQIEEIVIAKKFLVVTTVGGLHVYRLALLL